MHLMFLGQTWWGSHSSLTITQSAAEGLCGAQLIALEDVPFPG